MGNALLDNAYAPITFRYGFVESPFTQLADAFVSWQKEIHSKSRAGIGFKSFSAPLAAGLLRLEPLTTPQDRYLLIETRSPWTAIFSNGLRVNDVGSPVTHLPTILKCRGLEVTCIPDRSDNHAKDGLQIYGAVVFTLYGPERIDCLNRIRHVGVTRDIGGWEFAMDGEIQPYEQAENYRKRRVAHRFTAEMLEAYCATLGIDLFNADFYGGQCLLLFPQKPALNRLTMSISEAKSYLYLQS